MDIIDQVPPGCPPMETADDKDAEIERLSEALDSAIKIAKDHAEFCKYESQHGGHPSLFERSKGAEYIAGKIAALKQE